MPIHQEEQSFFGSEGQLYDLNQLFRAAHDLPIAEIAISDIAWGLRSDLDERDELRIQKADISIPILITYSETWGWLLVDGEHRCHQANRLGLPSLPGKILTSEAMDAARCEHAPL